METAKTMSKKAAASDVLYFLGNNGFEQVEYLLRCAEEKRLIRYVKNLHYRKIRSSFVVRELEIATRDDLLCSVCIKTFTKKRRATPWKNLHGYIRLVRILSRFLPGLFEMELRLKSSEINGFPSVNPAQISYLSYGRKET